MHLTVSALLPGGIGIASSVVISGAGPNVLLTILVYLIKAPLNFQKLLGQLAQAKLWSGILL